jgi:hypothetical protein
MVQARATSAEICRLRNYSVARNPRVPPRFGLGGQKADGDRRAEQTVPQLLIYELIRLDLG